MAYSTFTFFAVSVTLCLSMHQVLAMDAGEPARTSSVVVMVTVDDVNDNSAVFTEFTYQFSVPESSPVGAVVGTVTAVDTDLPPHNAVYYRLIDDDSQSSFSIDPRNGQLSINQLITSQ